MAGKKGMKWAPKIHSPFNIEQLRISIQAEKLIEALRKHTLGGKEMSPSQVTAGLGLIRKVLPDMTALEHSGEVAVVDVAEPKTALAERLFRQSELGSGQGSGQLPH